MSTIWAIILCSFSYAHSQISLLTHTKTAYAPQAREVAYSKTKQFNTTRLPQHCIKLKDCAKPFPRYLTPISRKGHYIKIVSDKNISEFIICKEDCPQELKRLFTTKEQKAFSNNKIVRFYCKNPQNNTWYAIATIPEQLAHKIISKAIAYPDGSIQL